MATRSQRALAQAAERRLRERFYIQFSYWNYATRTFVKGVWPLLFKSYDDAKYHTELCNPLQNMPRLANRGRIKSFTIEKIVLRKGSPRAISA